MLTKYELRGTNGKLVNRKTLKPGKNYSAKVKEVRFTTEGKIVRDEIITIVLEVKREHDE